MAQERVQRRLAAILAADVAGYSRLMGEDEEATLAVLTAHLTELIEPCIEEHRGRVVKTTGDGLLAEFASVVDAVRCAVAFQDGMAERNVDTAEDRRIEFRIGVNLGDVIVRGDDVYGDGVNVAARLEGVAEPGGICLSASAHEQVEGKIPNRFEAIGDRRLKNIRRPVAVYRLGDGAARHGAKAGMADRHGRRAIAVLPFSNLGADPEQEYFADGLTEDIISALSKSLLFSVISSTSTAAYKGKRVNVRTIGAELGAHYVLEGAVQKGGNRVRITVQLIDSESDHHIWSEKFDRDLENIFDLQDEITLRVATLVEPELITAEQEKIQMRRPASFDAWDLYLRGTAALKELSKDGNARAREYFEQAIVLDPSYSRAFGGLAWSHYRDVYLEFSEDSANSIEQCLGHARHAIALNDRDPFNHMALGLAYLRRGQYELAVKQVERAVDLSPGGGNPEGQTPLVLLGQTLTASGRFDEAIEHIRRGIDLNPKDRRNYLWMSYLSEAHLLRQDFEQAVEWARQALTSKSDFSYAHILLASALGHLGRRAEAGKALEECERLRPDFRKTWRDPWSFWPSEQIDHIASGLREAGLSE